MASSSPFFFAFFLLLSLFSVQILARDAQFFNKVSPTPTTTSGILPAQPTDIIPPSTTTVQELEQDPSFMQESQNGYGLYGQESTEQFPTTTKLAGNTPYTTTGTPSTYTPYKTPAQTQTQTQETYTNYPNSESNNNYYNNEQFTDTAYGEQQQNSGENRFQESNYAGDLDNQMNKKKNYYGYNGGFGNKNVERQGMSDTRFMENGKYYHDVKNENNYFPNQYQNSRNNYNYDSRAYNSNSNDENNAYEFNNSMENFQNQNQENEQYVP